MSEPVRRSSRAVATSPGEALAWVSALVFALSAFTGWYAAAGPGVTLSVIGWHTGAIGKLVFFVGLAALVLLVLSVTGFEFPPSVPLGAVVAAIGGVGTVLILVRVIDVPDRFAGTGRGIGLWISLAAAVLLVVAGFLKAGEEL